MSFISLDFLVFFPITAILFFLLPHKFRWCALLTASCIFYMAFIPVYILILLFTIVIDYAAGIIIERSGAKAKKIWLIISIIANTGVLAVFKYYNFFLDNFQLAGIFPILKIALPIGLSFHTLQAMAYTIEVYRGNQKAERHFGIYALYIMFFPQLVAGPIERPQNMLHQFHEEKIFDYNNAVSGLRLILWGFFKKIVIADRLALIVDKVYESPGSFSPWALLIATFFFAFQIYCDFSAYSDIALGTARIMGFKLMRNFDMPYQSGSIAEFWRRWHISLSSWFRDYLYIPLGGNRVSLPKWFFNLLIVFVLSGFWHGANRTFIIWGAINCIYIFIEEITKKYRHAFAQYLKLDGTLFYKWAQVFSTFLLIMMSWIFFRASSLSDSLLIFSKFRLLGTDLVNFIFHNKSLAGIPNIGKGKLFFYLLLVISLSASEFVINKRMVQVFYLPEKRFLRWLTYYAIIILIVVLGVFQKKDFIYFQF